YQNDLNNRQGLYRPLDKEILTICSFAVKHSERRKGIGSGLLMQLIHDVIEKSKIISKISLQVRVSNQSAINLYEKLGFHRCQILTRYYNDPVEDAYLMSIEGI